MLLEFLSMVKLFRYRRCRLLNWLHLHQLHQHRLLHQKIAEKYYLIFRHYFLDLEFLFHLMSWIFRLRHQNLHYRQ
jgi:hypothetical protein